MRYGAPCRTFEMDQHEHRGLTQSLVNENTEIPKVICEPLILQQVGDDFEFHEHTFHIIIRRRPMLLVRPVA